MAQKPMDRDVIGRKATLACPPTRTMARSEGPIDDCFIISFSKHQVQDGIVFNNRNPGNFLSALIL